MKTLNLFRNTKLAGIFSGLIVLTMVASSCNKDDNEIVLEGEAQVRVANASPNSAPQDFYLNDVKINANAVAYQESSAYGTADAGYGRKAEFKTSTSAAVNFTGYLDILPNEKYTFFYITQPDGTGSASAAFRDDQNPSSTRAKVRFVNLASGMTAANLKVSGGATYASNVAYGASSTFVEVEPGTFTYQTSLVEANSPLLNLQSYTLVAGKIYTIYISGSLATSVSSRLIVHN